MAKDLYDNDIDKYVDWGGDESTGWLPVSGRAVQKFIKDTLELKIGYIFEDREHNRCIGFADEDDYNIYSENPSEHQDLIIQSWYTYFPPAPVVLEYPVYYGTTQSPITTAQEITSQLSSTTSTSATCPSNKPYVYVCMYSSYHFTRAMTVNNEDILNQFIRKSDITINGEIYAIYEFHMASNLPLDVNINIQFRA